MRWSDRAAAGVGYALAAHPGGYDVTSEQCVTFPAMDRTPRLFAEVEASLSALLAADALETMAETVPGRFGHPSP